MKIPRKFRMVGLDWQVKYDDSMCSSHSAHGITDRRNHIIYLSPNNTPQMMQQTFFHELMHAAFWSMGLTNDFTPEQEEKIVYQLSSGLHSALIDNGLLQ